MLFLSSEQQLCVCSLSVSPRIEHQLIRLKLILQPVSLSDPTGRDFSEVATNRYEKKSSNKLQFSLTMSQHIKAHTEYTDVLLQTLEGMAQLSLLALFRIDRTKQKVPKSRISLAG